MAVTAVSLGACSLDLAEPNAPTESQVTHERRWRHRRSRRDCRGRFATSYFNYCLHGRVGDGRIRVDHRPRLISISDAEQCAVPSGTGIAENVFNSIYRTVRTADDLLTGANALASQIDPGTRSGLRALAFALKAESLGEALQSYQRIPINTFGVTAPTYVGRAEALTFVRALLDSAAATIAATAPESFSPAAY